MYSTKYIEEREKQVRASLYAPCSYWVYPCSESHPRPTSLAEASRIFFPQFKWNSRTIP